MICIKLILNQAIKDSKFNKTYEGSGIGLMENMFTVSINGKLTDEQF